MESQQRHDANKTRPQSCKQNTCDSAIEASTLAVNDDEQLSNYTVQMMYVDERRDVIVLLLCLPLRAFHCKHTWALFSLLKCQDVECFVAVCVYTFKLRKESKCDRI